MRLSKENTMILTNEDLKKELSNYSNINAKISRLLKEKKLFSLKKGLYENNKNIDGIYLTSVIYFPSYISFLYALYFYDLIPEYINKFYTSASLSLNKKKIYINDFGTYEYRYIYKKAFFKDVIKKEFDVDGVNYNFYIASKEKAIVDTLYISPILKNIGDLAVYLFEDLRINEYIFYSLNREKLIELANDFDNSTNLKLFIKYLNKRRIIDEFNNINKTFKIY